MVSDPKITRGMDSRTGAIVLAAGKGTRMGSPLPKVLHDLAGRPMILRVTDLLSELGFGNVAPMPVLVVGFGASDVQATVGDDATYAIQHAQAGTGDAADVGLRQISADVDRVLLVHGDEPLISRETYEAMLSLHTKSRAAIVLLTGEVSDTHALGRVIRDQSGCVLGLVQESELTPEQRDVREINFGAYVFDRAFMEESLRKLEKHPGGEYYLTDLVRIAVDSGRTVESVSVPYPDEQMGINDAGQLARAEAFLRGLDGDTHNRGIHEEA